MKWDIWTQRSTGKLCAMKFDMYQIPLRVLLQRKFQFCKFIFRHQSSSSKFSVLKWIYVCLFVCECILCVVTEITPSCSLHCSRNLFILFENSSMNFVKNVIKKGINSFQHTEWNRKFQLFLCLYFLLSTWTIVYLDLQRSIDENKNLKSIEWLTYINS